MEDEDERFLLHGLSYSPKAAYSEDAHAALIWRSRAPHKLNLFAWLLFHGLSQHLPLAAAPLVKIHPTCSSLARTPPGCWAQAGLSTTRRFQDLWFSQFLPLLDSRIWPQVLLVLLGEIWDSRNAAACRGEDHPSLLTIRNIVVTDFELVLFSLSRPR